MRSVDSLANSGTLPRMRIPNVRSASNAASRCDDRTAPAPYPRDAVVQAALTRSNTSGEMSGFRLLPVLNLSSSRSSSRRTWAGSAPNAEIIWPKSAFAASSSLSSQCSSSAVKWVRDTHRPRAASSAFLHVGFRAAIIAFGVTADIAELRCGRCGVTE